MQLPFDQIDAFTRQPFGGNPAAVVLTQTPLDEATMQAVGAEMNLSETAFVGPPAAGMARPIRYFTPTLEVPLCGHATLASAHCLWERGILRPDEPAVFTTIDHATLTCTRGTDGMITMDLPADLPQPAESPIDLGAALGVTPKAIVRGVANWLVEAADEPAVRSAQPDFVALGDVELGIILTAPSDAHGVDFVSRFFAPAAGINEDPVTGSAHCLLGPYWASKLGKTQLRAYQASTRGGDLWVTVREPRVDVAGYAVTMTRGELYLPV